MGERPRETPGIEIVADEDARRQRDALTGRCRLKGQVRVRKHRTARRVDALDPHGGKPAFPGDVVGHGFDHLVQKRVVAQIARLAERLLGIAEKRGAADGKDLFQEVGSKPRPVAAAKTDDDVDVLAGEVGTVRGDRDAHVQVGMALPQPAQSRNRPVRGETRQRADGQGARALGLSARAVASFSPSRVRTETPRSARRRSSAPRLCSGAERTADARATIRATSPVGRRRLP